MTRKYDIPNNLCDISKKQAIDEKKREWASYMKPQEGDIMIINGSHDARFVYYLNRWCEFKF